MAASLLSTTIVLLAALAAISAFPTSHHDIEFQKAMDKYIIGIRPKASLHRPSRRFDPDAVMNDLSNIRGFSEHNLPPVDNGLYNELYDLMDDTFDGPNTDKKLDDVIGSIDFGDLAAVVVPKSHAKHSR